MKSTPTHTQTRVCVDIRLSIHFNYWKSMSAVFPKLIISPSHTNTSCRLISINGIWLAEFEKLGSGFRIVTNFSRNLPSAQPGEEYAVNGWCQAEWWQFYWAFINGLEFDRPLKLAHYDYWWKVRNQLFYNSNVYVFYRWFALFLKEDLEFTKCLNFDHQSNRNYKVESHVKFSYEMYNKWCWFKLTSW